MRLSSRHHRPGRRHVVLLAATLSVAGIVAFPSTASAAECAVTRSSTTAVTLGANLASEPGVAIVASYAAPGATGATFTFSGLPAGVSSNGATGSISGAAAEGEYRVTVTASAPDATTCALTFTWYVNAAESGTITPEIPPDQIPSESLAPTPLTPAAATPSASEGALAFTGGDVAGLVLVGLGAVGLGGLLLWSQRRRQADQPTG